MIQPTYGVLQTLFADRVFRIPHYQRFYSWQTRQREDLFEDLKKLFAQGEDQHHFMATLVCYRTPETKAVGTNQYRIYDIVDGQQRLTTIIILLKCIELAITSGSEIREDLAKILVKRDGHLILLQTNNANERIFNRFIREGVSPVAADLQIRSDFNLAKAIHECNEFVAEWQEENNLGSLLSLVLHRLGFVVHDTEDSRAVYTVFEVLNSRGLAVDWLDKTKSMLMGRAYELASSSNTAEAEIQSLQNLWGEIYREIAKEDVSGDEILRVTATLYFGTGAGKPRSAEDSLQQLNSNCNSFSDPRKLSELLLGVARKLTVIYGNVFLGPVTDILHARLLAVALMMAKGVNEQERTKLLDQWERVSFRIFGLFSKDSRTKVGDYTRLAAKIVSEDIETRTYNQIMAAIRELGSDYPIDVAVTEGIVDRDIYEDSPEVCRYMLWLYEEYLTKKQSAAATVDEQARIAIWKKRAVDSIEHIYPQNPGDSGAWKARQRTLSHVGRIGNLILLPIALNQEAKTKPFDEKKQSYKKHNLRMIQEVCDASEWTLAQIMAREQKFVEWAKTQWNDL